MANPNLQTIAAAWQVGADKTPIVIDLLKNSPLLQTAAVAKASHGIKHRYRYFESLPTAAFREVGQGITPQRLDQNSAQIDLKELMFKLYDDYRVIDEYPGGKDAWMRDNYEAAIAGLTQALSKAVYYGNTPTVGLAGSFKGLYQYATDMSTIANKSAAGGSQTSIYAVRWDAQNGASLRFNNTALMDVRDLTPNNPVPIVTDTTSNTQLDVYQWMFASYFTLVMPSKSVAILGKVDASTNKPTVDEMNALVDKIDKIGGTKAIYTSRVGMRAIALLKHDKLNMFMETMDMNHYLASWRGVPIYVDENIATNENF